MPQGEHVFFMAHGAWDLPLLERLRSIRREGLKVSIWMPEIWPSDLRDDRLRYECYSMVDHIFVGLREAVEPFARIAPSAQVHVLPPAVDVMRFAPADPFADRGISVLGIGRRDASQHSELIEWSAARKRLYLYDTVSGKAVDWEAHREALANWYQHANVSVCNFAKHDVPAETEGLRVLPGRLFEGLAAGSILIGLPPDDERQLEVLGTTVVEPLDGSPHQLPELLDRFLDPVEAQTVRVRNLALACRGHDWGHRWAAALEAVGVEVPFGLRNRIDDLAKKADEFEELAAGR